MTWLESLSIDGVTVPAWRKVRGLAGSPAPRVETYERARRHGVVDYTEDYGPRLIELEDCVLRGAPAAIFAAHDALKGAMALGTEHVLRFRRPGQSTDERATVRVTGELTADLDYASQGVLFWSVPLLAADPRTYNDVVTTARYSPGAAAGGLDFPLAFPLVFSSSGASLLTVTNAGNFWTPPTFTVEGPADGGFSIVNEATGDAIVTTGLALAAGDSITIDVDTREVIVGGTSRPDYLDAAQSTWFELAAGDTPLRLHGSGFSDDVTTLTVTYRDARI